MKIEEYLRTLPDNVLSGEDVELPEKTLREIFKFANLNENDIFYHLGCGNQKGVELAKKEFQAKKAIGIDNNKSKIEVGNNILKERKIDAELLCQ